MKSTVTKIWLYPTITKFLWFTPRVIYTCLFVFLFICRKCTLIEVRFTSAYCVFWACFVSFLTAGFIKLNDNSEDNFGTVRNRQLTLFWKTTKLPKRTNSKILFLLILVILKIPWTILLTDSSCVLKCLLRCMVKLYTKYYFNSTFQIFPNSGQTGLFSKKQKSAAETILKFRYSE